MVCFDVVVTSDSEKLGLFLEWNEGTGLGGTMIVVSMTVLKVHGGHVLRVGDVIKAIQGVFVADMAMSDIESMLKNARPVVLGITRERRGAIEDVVDEGIATTLSTRSCGASSGASICSGEPGACPWHGAHKHMFPIPRGAPPHWKEHSEMNKKKCGGTLGETSYSVMPYLHALSERGMPPDLYGCCESLVTNPPNGTPPWRPSGPLGLVLHKGANRWNSYMQLVCYECSRMTQFLWLRDADAVWRILRDFLAPYLEASAPYWCDASRATRVEPVPTPRKPGCTYETSLRLLEGGWRENQVGRGDMPTLLASSVSTPAVARTLALSGAAAPQEWPRAEPVGEQDSSFLTVNVVEPGRLVAKGNGLLERDGILSVNGCNEVENIHLQRGSTYAPGAAVAAETGVPPTSPFVATAEYDPHVEFKTGYLPLGRGDRVHVYRDTDAAADPGDRFPRRQYVFATRPDAATNPAEWSEGWVPRDVLRAVQCT